jgi:hypothetical protein
MGQHITVSIQTRAIAILNEGIRNFVQQHLINFERRNLMRCLLVTSSINIHNLLRHFCRTQNKMASLRSYIYRVSLSLRLIARTSEPLGVGI